MNLLLKWLLMLQIHLVRVVLPPLVLEKWPLLPLPLTLPDPDLKPIILRPLPIQNALVPVYRGVLLIYIAYVLVLHRIIISLVMYIPSYLLPWVTFLQSPLYSTITILTRI